MYIFSRIVHQKVVGVKVWGMMERIIFEFLMTGIDNQRYFNVAIAGESHFPR
jgi:hypothetical protein